MTHLVVQFECDGGSSPCGVCGRRTPVARGPQLGVAETLEPVCRDCGRKHAPDLAALVELARAAERVGKIGRHTVSPPLTALLDLARAAENYSAAQPPRRLQAA